MTYDHAPIGLAYSSLISFSKILLATFLLIFNDGVRMSDSIVKGSSMMWICLIFSNPENLFLAAKAFKSPMTALLKSSLYKISPTFISPKSITNKTKNINDLTVFSGPFLGSRRLNNTN